MIEINLIRDRALTKQLRDKIKKTVVGVGAGLGVLFIAVILYYTGVSVNLNSLRNELEEINSEIVHMREIYEIDKWHSEWGGLYKRVKTMEQIFTERTKYTPVLVELAKLIPENVHIQSIEANRGEKAISTEILTLSGKEGDENIDEFVEAIEGSDIFSPGIDVVEKEEIEIRGEKFLRYRLDNISVSF